jgi:transposase
MELRRPAQTELDQMSPEEKDRLIMMLFDTLNDLEKRVQAFESKIEKNSQNSSKPPSSDGLKKSAAQPRERGKRSSGGQTGHKGVTRQMVNNPDVTVDLYPPSQCTCGVLLENLPSTLGERRQQIEIPAPKHEVTEYRQRLVTCTCGRVHPGEFPSHVTPHVSYGPRLKSYAVGLVLGHFISLKRVCSLLADQYEVNPSDGTIQNWLVAASEHLKPEYEDYRDTIRHSDVAHFDESGLRVNGQLNWLHVATTETTVYYSSHAKRGLLAMNDAGILPDFKGCAVHDHWKSYWNYTECSHSLCNSHHLRELAYCEELTGHYWPIALRKILLTGKEAVATARQAGQTALDAEILEQLMNQYDRQVANGLAACPIKQPAPDQKGRVKQDEATNLLIRLRDYKEQTLKFLTDWRVPFDNNLAERMVRPIKVKLKVSGGFRAAGGSEAFCILRSIWETNKLQNRNPFDTFRFAFAA